MENFVCFKYFMLLMVRKKMGGWYIYAFFELGLIEPKIKISYLKWIKYIRKYSVNNNIQEHFFYFSQDLLKISKLVLLICYDVGFLIKVLLLMDFNR